MLISGAPWMTGLTRILGVGWCRRSRRFVAVLAGFLHSGASILTVFGLVLLIQTKDITLTQWTVMMELFEPKIQAFCVIDMAALQLSNRIFISYQI